MPTPDDLTPEERLRIDNELTKARLSDDVGAVFGEMSRNMTPEIEAQFLANIQVLEAGGPDSHVPIRTLLPRDLLRQVAAMAARDEHGAAIAMLLRALQQAGVATEQPEWIYDEAYYHFLATDFLDHTIPPPPPVTPGSEMRHAIGVTYDQVRLRLTQSYGDGDGAVPQGSHRSR